MRLKILSGMDCEEIEKENLIRLKQKIESITKREEYQKQLKESRSPLIEGLSHYAPNDKPYMIPGFNLFKHNYGDNNLSQYTEQKRLRLVNCNIKD